MSGGEDCTRMRELVSSALDQGGRESAEDLATLEHHLRDCAPCRAWQEQAVFLQRQLAAARLDPPAGLTGALAAAASNSRRRSQRWIVLIRAALAGLSAAGLILALPALALGQDDGIEIHAAHELGSTEVALCIGLLAAAIWPRRARGILAVLGAAAGLLVITASADIASGYTTLAHEAPHGIAVGGAALVWVLTRLVPETAPPVLLPASALSSSNERKSEPKRLRAGRVKRILAGLTMAAALAACGSSAPKATAPMPMDTQTETAVAVNGIQTLTVEGTDALMFAPTALRAKVGKLTVTFKNVGAIAHTFRIVGTAAATGNVAGHTQTTLTVTLTRPGVYPIACDYHPTMTGTLTVTA